MRGIMMSEVNELLKIIASAARQAVNNEIDTCTVKLRRSVWGRILDIEGSRRELKVIKDGNVTMRIAKLSSGNGVLVLNINGVGEIALPIVYTEYIRLVVPQSIADKLKKLPETEGIICEELS